jgi:hypothetical protein
MSLYRLSQNWLPSIFFSITKKSDQLLNNNKKSLISHKSIKYLGNWNFDVFRYKNSLTFICHQHQDLTSVKDNNFEIKQ